MDDSAIDILLWNWEPLASTLGVGLLGVAVTAWRTRSRPTHQNTLLAFAWAAGVFALGAALALWNGAAVREDVLYTHDPSPPFVLDIWRAEQIVSTGILLSALVPALILLGLGVVASRRAV